jgi:hypothetical protein
MQARSTTGGDTSRLTAPFLARTFCALAVGVVVSMLGACGGTVMEAASRPDQRTPIELTKDEAEELRAGMRAYLASIQGIVEALPRNKMAQVASAAKQAGMGMVDDIPVALVLKLPPGFVVLSMDTHQKFDALARTAEEAGTKSSVLASLQEILANCTACHSSYRIAAR